MQAAGVSLDAVVGLDLSLSNTGIAVITADNQADYFSFGQKLKSRPGNYDLIKRYITLAQRIIQTLQPYNIKTIAIENYGFGSKRLAPQAEFGGIVKSQIYLALRKVPVVVPSTTVRKLLLGHARHEDLKLNVQTELLRLGYPMMSDFDQSDALAVAHVVRMLDGKKSDFSDDEKKAKDKLTGQRFRG